MPRKDRIHETVRLALEKDGWIITYDPFTIEMEEGRRLEIDLAAEKLLVAKKGSIKIAVEVKSFIRPSIINSFHEALGQYLNYRDILTDGNWPHAMILAIPSEAFEDMLASEFMSKQLKRYKIELLVVDLNEQIIEQWIN